METHGVRLRKFFEGKDLSFSQITRRLGHGSRNTLSNWFDRDELTTKMFSKLVNVFPDIRSEFPDVEWASISLLPNQVHEIVTTYSSNELSDFKEELAQLRKEHIELLTRYNKMLEEYVNLLKEHDR